MDMEITINDNDGMGWMENGKIVINIRWSDEDSIVDDIVSTFIHEYIEHVLGLGHDNAVKGEKIVMKLLKDGDDNE